MSAIMCMVTCIIVNDFIGKNLCCKLRKEMNVFLYNSCVRLFFCDAAG